MTTRIHPTGSAGHIQTTQSAPRVTPAPARPFQEVVRQSANAVVDGAESAVRKLPGGPIVAAAVRPGGGRVSADPTTSAEGSSGTAPSNSGAPGQPSIESALSENADNNLYYLELQQRISAETRAYSALSNVLKARHDTVKNAINNIR